MKYLSLVMESFEVVHALGDSTRYAIFELLASSKTPMSASDLAAELDLHANTVRLHLEKLSAVGLVSSSISRQGSVGRPHHKYSAPTEMSIFNTSSSTVIADLLLSLAKKSGATCAQAIEVGRAWGASTKATQPKENNLDILVVEMDRLGFDPQSEGGGRVKFGSCPYRDLAQEFPDLVCSMHEGICRGSIESNYDVESFNGFFGTDPCSVQFVERRPRKRRAI